MHKKLAADLTDLAHKILRMSNKDDIIVLKEKAHELYEKLAVLAYVEEYINTTPQSTQTKEELIAKVEKATIRKEIEAAEIIKEPAIESNIEPIFDEVVEQEIYESVQHDVIVETPEKEIIKKEAVEELKEVITEQIENEKFDEASFIEEQKTPTLEDELKDTVSIDITADLFTKVEPKKSLNDHLQKSLQIGLNDRIAFVKHLFDGDQADYNRVISQLNTLDSEKEAKKFLNKNVKPDYDWSNKEEYETRLLEIVERRFS